MKRKETNAVISFLGGASNIGASCILVEVDYTKILIDAGIKIEAKSPLPDLSMLNNKKIDAILLSHAHLDHSGALPIIKESFPAAPIYATPPTIDIIRILLYDTIKISEKEGEIPLYTIKQLDNLFDKIIPINFYQPFKINDIEVTFLPASHIIGASMIHLSTSAGNILYTGDYSVTVQNTVPSLSLPSLPVDCIITEATYGARLHENRSIAELRLINKIKEIIQDDGIVLIPCFAIGRAQEILLTLLKAFNQRNLPKVPVYVDGMVKNVCNVYKNHEFYVTRWLAKEIKKVSNPFFQSTIQPVLSAKERNKIVSQQPAIIIASSGMLKGGASVYYAKLVAQYENNAILITGYQDEESPGKVLLNLADKTDNKILNLDGKDIEIKCKIEKYSLSAHADKLQIISFIESIKPNKIILIHGDEEAKLQLSDALSSYENIRAYDGLIVEFSAKKTKRKEKIIKFPNSIDRTNLQHLKTLLGSSIDKPLPAREIAKKIFGELTNPKLINILADWLESLKLVKRDDKNRTMLWILPQVEEYKLDEEIQLKKDNPKGRLMEMCMQLKLESPKIKINTFALSYSEKQIIAYNPNLCLQ